MGLKIKMWILVALLFGILYGVITGIGAYIGLGNPWSNILLAVLFMGIQYMVGPSLVSMLMRVKYVSDSEEPELHQMVAELARRAGIPRPKVGISQISIPNAFAFGKSQADGRVCVTQGIKSLLSKEELRAVLGHEISHLKHRDMMIITLLSVIPLIFYWLAQSFIWGGALGNKREVGSWGALIGIGAMMVYFVTNLLVMYGSRIREYYADEGSVALGNPPHHLASGLYKLVYSSAHLSQTAGGKQELHKLAGVKALFINDISRSWKEVRKLKELDTRSNGTIDQNEFFNLKFKVVKLRTSEKILEILTTHPNTLKRIKRLATLA